MKVQRDARDQARMALWIWLAALGSSFALAPLTESRSYILVGFVSAGLVTLVGFGLRTLRTPWPLTLLAEVAALFWWAMLTYASETTTFGLIPTGDTFRAFDTILTDALNHAQEYAAPVPADPSLHALLAISVGLLAIAVDLLAGSLQQAPAVGLVFLAVYMAPVALLSGHVSLWFFVPGALAYVFLIAAEERSTVARWGRNISYADSTALAQTRGIYSSGLASAGRRVGFGAVALAVVVPIVVPTFATNFFGSGGIDGSAQGGDGGSGEVRVGDPMADMRRNLTGQSDRELLRMTGTTTPSYVRLAALDDLSDAGWQASERGPKTTSATSGTLPYDSAVDSDVAISSATFEVNVSDDFDSTWLPTIYQPVSLADIDDDGEWLSDSVNLDIVAGNGDTNASGMQYTLNVRYTSPTRQQVLTAGGRVPSSVKSMLSLPASTPDIVKERAEEVAGDENSQFDQAHAIQDWFRSSGGFTYSTAQASGNGMETIERFLTDDRVGYCEQFASAMAMMARELGIPARVTVGFLDGEPSGGDTYVFRGTDMHAWPELYLDGIGWTPFEPTPGQRTGAAPDFFNEGGATDPSDPLNPNGQSRTPTDDSSPSANLDKADAASGGGGGDDDSGFPWLGAGIAVLVVALLAALCFVPRTLRSMVRRRRWALAADPAQAAESAWDELRDTVRDLRLPWPDGATPRATGRRLRPLVESRHRAVDGLNRLVLSVERARYAEHNEPLDLRDDVHAIGEALASRVSRRTRRKALWLPVSLLGEFRSPWRSAGRSQRSGGQHELLALEE